MDSPQPTPAPDPVATANAQTASNKATATTQYGLDATNQITPQGNLTYSQIGTWSDGTPRFQSATTLNPQEQSIYNTNAQTRQNVGQIGQDQSSRIASLLGSPFSFQGLPSSVSNVQGGPLQNSVNSAGPINNSIANAGPLNNSIAGAGPVNSSIANAGSINNSIAGAGPVNNSIANAGNINGSVANAGHVQTSIGGDTSADRQRVEDAIYSRLNPQLDRDTSALQTKLINQGVRPGSAAYQNAIDADNRSRNDARMQAVLAGGQEQSREFGIDQSKGQFANSAQGQQYSQNANDTSVANAAQLQRYGQNANDAQFANTAQQQRYGQNANDANFFNAAQQQQFGQNQASAVFGNAAQQQQFGQNSDQAAFGNNAQQQQFTQNAAQLAAQQAAQQQQYGQNANDAQFANAAQQQQFGQGTANAALNNASRQSGIGEQALLRETPINEISALLSGSQVSQPGFTNTPQPGVAPTDVIGAQQQALNQSNVGYQGQVAQNNAITSGLFGLGSAGLGGWGYGGFKTSDRRAKENIKRVGKTDDGLPVYTYSYKGNGGLMEMGVMAQDLMKEKPEAIGRGPRGLMAVDYGQVA